MEDKRYPNGAIKLASAPQCVTCKTEVNGLTQVTGDRMPKAGDLTICQYCGEIMGFEFKADGVIDRLRPANAFEMGFCALDNGWMIDASKIIRDRWMAAKGLLSSSSTKGFKPS